MADMIPQPTPRVWIITGSNSGIGLAIATYVLAKGDKVVATVRSLDKLPQSLKDLGAHPLVLDLSGTDKDIKCAAEDALQVYGRVDVLVNNAGWGTPSPWELADLDQIRAQFQTLFFGTVAFTQTLLPHLRNQRSGHILNVSSVGSFYAGSNWGAYSAAKAAINVFTDSLHMELKPFGVEVLALIPGYFPTPFMRASDKKESHKPDQVYTGPMQVFGSGRGVHEVHHDAGMMGDVDKLAERVFEVVTKTGMAEQLALDKGGQDDWTIIPLGIDCEFGVKNRLKAKLENVDGTEAIWRSVGMAPEKQALVPRDIASL